MEQKSVPETSAEYRSIPFEWAKEADGDKTKGRGKAIVSRIGVVDTYKSVMEPGAFRGNRSEVPILANHNWSDNPPLGVMKVKEQGEEVIGEFRFNMNLPIAQHWVDHLEFANRQEFSIGFVAMKQRWLTDEEMEERKDGAYRIIEKLRLLEVSLVVSGAMKDTKLLELRNEALSKIPVEEPETKKNDLTGIYLPEYNDFVEEFALHSRDLSLLGEPT